jgi:hypothetical protein
VPRACSCPRASDFRSLSDPLRESDLPIPCRSKSPLRIPMDLIGSGCSSSPGFTARGELAFMKPVPLSALRDMVARQSSTCRAFRQHAIHSPAHRAPSPLRSFDLMLAPRHLKGLQPAARPAAPSRELPWEGAIARRNGTPPGRPPRPDRQTRAPPITEFPGSTRSRTDLIDIQLHAADNHKSTWATLRRVHQRLPPNRLCSSKPFSMAPSRSRRS